MPDWLGSKAIEGHPDPATSSTYPNRAQRFCTKFGDEQSSDTTRDGCCSPGIAGLGGNVADGRTDQLPGLMVPLGSILQNILEGIISTHCLIIINSGGGIGTIGI